MQHTVTKSPFEKNSLYTCVRLSKAGSAILLIEDGVYGALAGTSFESQVRDAMPGRKFFVLGPAFAARGTDKVQLIGGIEVGGIDGLVELAVGCGKVQTWF